jgi:hypothetical protein
VKEAVDGYFKALPRDLPGGTEKNYEKLYQKNLLMAGI